MTPGPTIIRQCGACGQQLAQHTINSGNTFVARLWTDGKREAPMLPAQPLLVKCPHCQTLVWIDELAEVGDIEPWAAETSEDSSYPNARAPTIPTFDDYLAYLRAQSPDHDQARYLRIQAWHAGNDPRREQQTETPLYDSEIENLKALIQLLDEADETDRLMKAEALRQLGEFEHAQRLLAGAFAAELTQAVTLISQLVQQQIDTVREMTPSETA